MAKKRYGFRVDLKQICRFNSNDQMEEPSPSRQTVEVYENQARKSYVGGKFSIKSSNMMGRSEFTDKDGHAVDGPSENLQPASGMCWAGSWKIDDFSMGVDSNGWSYASSWTGPWGPSSNLLSTVRRRRWHRQMTPIVHHSSVSVEENAGVLFKHAHLDGDIIAQAEQFNGISAENLWFAAEVERFIKDHRLSLPDNPRIKPSTRRSLFCQ